MSYFTPPPSANGSSWGHTAHPQQGHQPLPGPSHPNSQQQNVNPMFAMMAMMQQMQGYPAQNYPQQFAQPQMAAQVVEPQRMSIPQVTDNSLIAQILYEQTKRGLTYKAALESLHGHNGIAAYAWKDHFLEHKQSIDELVDKLKEQAAAAWIKLEPHRPSSASMDGQSISNSTAVKRQPDSTPARANSETKREKLNVKDPEKTMPYTREDSEPRRPKPSKKLSSDVAIKKVKETNVKKMKSAPKEVAGEGGSSRRTLNSLSSTPAQTLLALIPSGVPIDAHTGLPAAPSRSPSPPIKDPIHKFSDQDAVYFFKRIAYDLQKDSDLTKANLCDILGEKAPHHSAMSWKTLWNKKEDVADKMLLLTRLDDIDREEVIRSWKTGRSIAGPLGTGAGRVRSRARVVSYKENSDSEVSEMEIASNTSIAEEDEVEEKVNASLGGTNDDSDIPSTDDDEKLGEAGSPFTIAEIRALAKHIAKQPDWYTGRKEWESFFRAHSQRSGASWREFYRRRADEVDSYARKYMSRSRKGHLSTQRGKPSWARGGLNKGPQGESVSAKRFYDLSQDDSDSREGSEEKRPRYSD